MASDPGLVGHHNAMLRRPRRGAGAHGDLAHYLTVFRRDPTFQTPEAQLVIAHLMQAFDDLGKLTSPVRRHQSHARDALAWVFEVRWDGPFSFTWTCAMLRLEPEAVRAAVRVRFGALSPSGTVQAIPQGVERANRKAAIRAAS